jgi:hypothetical protein
MRPLLLLSTTLLCVAACAKAPPATRGSGQSATAAAAAKAPAANQDVPQEKRPRNGEASVYVDGQQVGVVRALELPLTLKAHDIPQKTGGPRHVYFVGEYLQSLGVDLSKVTAVHAHGGNRVALLDGDEFRRVKNDLQLSFTMVESGKPRLRWAMKDLKANTTIDVISALTVYIDKPAPTLDADGDLLYPDGQRVEGIAYAPKETSKGTRVYVDGKLVATVKRKELPNTLLLGDDVANPTFSLARYLDSVKVDATHAKAMDFLSGDSVIRREDSKAWSAEKAEFAFTLPRHNQGKVAVAAGGAKAAKVSALQIFISKEPPARTIQAPTSDDTGSGGGGGGGGGGGNAPGGGADDEL